ncbi:hypothetical protein G5I_02220 [Acromyrmex echinatior]|uniref:RRM domain-containing protein n=1 Tax=Acromyrmex echinatior TaxID=103372 RepID=F4W9R4_ACREC|nr:hypothetical protein G5I_02220 [Acromyrmex echinatior]
MENFNFSNLNIVQSGSADMFFKMVLHVQSDQRMASPYRASSFSRAREKKRTLRHMHGYHETLINCGASPPGSRLLCILRAGPRKTTCLSAPANFKMIYRPRKTKFFAVLRGFSAAPKGTADAFDMQLWPVWARSVKLTSLIDCYFISSPSICEKLLCLAARRGVKQFSNIDMPDDTLKTLYVGNLDHVVSEDLLYALFSHIGSVRSCKIIRENCALLSSPSPSSLSSPLPASKLKAAYSREALGAFEQTSRDSRAKCNFEDERRTLSIQDPSKLGSFDLESLSDVAGYGIRQRSFALVKVPVSRGKGSWRRPFSLFLEFYLSGVGYLRLRRGIRGRGCNTGRGKIRQDVERSSSVTATKFRPQSLKESLVSQQPTAVQLSCILSCSLLFSWQSRELWLRHARRAANAQDGQRSKKTKRQMRRNVEL